MCRCREPRQKQSRNKPLPEKKPTTIAGLIGGWFSGSKAKTPAPALDKDQVAARTAVTDLTELGAAPVRTATPAPVQNAQVAPNARRNRLKPERLNTAAPAAASAVQTAKSAAYSNRNPHRVYSTPPASNNGFLPGAQPVVPVGTFNNFR